MPWLKRKVVKEAVKADVGQVQPISSYHSGVLVFPRADRVAFGENGQTAERVERVQEEVSGEESALNLAELVSWQDTFHGQTGDERHPHLDAKRARQAKQVDEGITAAQLVRLIHVEVLG